jgi:DNA-directed RNA polymerase specialized sigma24 family protein
MTLFTFKLPIPDGAVRRSEDSSRERMFLEHYSWLRECALNITHGQRDRSEDLVHDVFLQFLDKDLDVASVADVRGYLNGILRNLHLLQLRRATRHPAQPLSLFDHDSALIGLRVWTSAEQLQCADLLVQACDFACHRKETSLAASVLILRYFHGYYPGEICLLLRTERKVIYRWIDRGRTEAKQYMESPYALPGCEGPERKTLPSGPSPNAFLRRLRERIFNSCTTDCSILSRDRQKLGVKELAHLVSCQPCLERCSRKIGLADVAERMADDISDRDDGRPQGGVGGSGQILPLRSDRKPSRRSFLRQAYARRRERFEHRPKEISLAFDGQLRATLVVNAPTNTLHLSLDRKELPDSIAILSEQEFHFLILDRRELSCSERRIHRLTLSDNRFLEVTVTPETLGPCVHVVYEDPLFLALATASENCDLQTITVEEPVLSFPPRSFAPVQGARAAWRAAWRGQLGSLVPAMNPFLASAMVLGVASLLCLVLWLRSGTSLSAGDLLDQAQTSDRGSVVSNRAGVIYERVAIRTQHRTVERTICRDAQGVRRTRNRQLSYEDQQLKDKLASAGVNWDAPLSAVDYAEWRRRSGPTRDRVTRSGQHLLTLTTTPLADAAVLKETFTVRDTDFHAVDRTVELRDSGTVEIAQLNYDVLPWAAVNQDWFEPLPAGAATDAPGILSTLAVHAPRMLSALELDEAELETRIALHQLNADAGERIHLARTSDGIQVKGVVDTDARKQELISRLSQLRHVRASFLSVEELGSHPQSGSPFSAGEPLRVYSVEAQASPLERYLRDKKLPVDELASISQSLLDGGLRIQQAEVHFYELQPRFQGVDQLSVNLQGQLADLSLTYLRTIETGLDANNKTLQSLGLDDSNATATPPESSAPGESANQSLDQPIRRYQELCQEVIAGGTGQSRSAPAIATELTTASARIRLSLRQLSATVPRAHE